MSVQSPQVAVVIPTYNAEKFLRTTIDSVLGQSYSNIEIIVIDDGSRDNTCDIVRGYGNRVRLIEQSNSGVCAARNRGLKETQAPYICFLDHDDFWFPNKIEYQVKILETNKSLGLVYSAFTRWDERNDGTFAEPASLCSEGRGDELDHVMSGWIYHQLLIDCWVLTSTAMIRVAALKDVGAFNVELPYAEDWDLWLRLSRRYEFAKLRLSTTLYRQHRQQGSRVVRPIDYRTRLLSEAVARWGLASPDGTALPRKTFASTLASYHLSYGFDRLKVDQVKLACQSFYSGWQLQPLNVKPLVYIFAALAGWRPSW